MIPEGAPNETRQAMHERLTIVVVGGNRIAAQLITDFMSRSFVDVVAVADINDDSPGAFTATQLGIPFTDNVKALAEMAPSPDLVIDMAEWPEIDSEIRAAYPGSVSGSPTVIHDAGARLVLGLAADTTETISLRSPVLATADC